MSNSKPGPSGRRTARRRGQSMVEFALVLPIFMLILSGILDFGFMLYTRMSVINAAREGARAAVTVTSPDAIEPTATGAATSAAAGGGLSVSSVTTTCYAGTSSSVKLCTDAASGDSVAVTVAYTYHTFFPLAFGSSFDLTSTVQMVLE